ncbi:MAG: hypothetical protein WAN65_20280 [Candidatus Sulfotelmatobacter sp.]
MKKWRHTILLTLVSAALAVTAHWWVPRLLPFLGIVFKNKETVGTFKDFVQIVVGVVTLAIPLFKVAANEKEKKAAKRDSVTASVINSRADHDLNTADGNIQTGGVSSTSQGPVSIGGHVAGRDVKIYQSSTTPRESSREPAGTHRMDDGRLTGIDWSARDQKLLHEYFSRCAKYDDDFRGHVELDETLVKEYFLTAGLAAPSLDGVMRLSEAGALLCCKRKHLPHKDLHVNVKFQNKTDPADLTEELYGSVMLLYLELFKRLEGLSQRKMGSPNIRDEGGGEAVFVDYPRVAIIEALVNFLIHRDYTPTMLALSPFTRTDSNSSTPERANCPLRNY